MWPEGMQKISMHAHECNDETDFYPDSQKNVMAFYAFFQYFTGDYSVDCVIAL